LLVAGTAAFLALAAGAVYLWWPRRAPAPAAARTAPAAASYTGPTVSLPGVIEAAEVVAVPVPIDGTIERFLADVGQNVSEGQPLAQIRNSELESERETTSAELSRERARVSTMESRLISMRLEASRARERAIGARGEVDAAQKKLQRQQLLFSKGATAKLALDKAQQDFEAAQTDFDQLDQVARMSEQRAAEVTKELDASRQTLDNKTQAYEGATEQVASGEVASPVDGFVLARRGQPGDGVTIEMEDLFRIAVNLSSLKVMVQPEPSVLERIHPGQEAVIQIAELPEGIVGKVSEVQGKQVWIEFTNTSPIVKPGMTAQVVIKLT
jgi:multidrug efflux pump subunit AcrA (membrane-fusion protein)